MRNSWTVARREYALYFNSPLAYTVSFAILLVLGIFFGLSIAYFTRNAAQAYGSVPNAGVITGPFAFMLVLSAPALTMGLFAAEKHSGTLELLMTAPVRDWELVLGKWLGSFLFMLTLIGITLIFPLVANALIEPGIDWGRVAASYVGIVLVSGAFLSLGTGISTLFDNQIAAFFTTLISFVALWWLVGFPAQFASPRLFHYLDMSAHFYYSLNAGVVALGDLVYFLSLIALGLFLGTASLLRWRRGHWERRFSSVALAFFGVLFVLNFYAYKNPHKWDLTANQSRTLASETLETLAALPEKVDALAFFSKNADMAAAEELLLNFKANGNFDYQFVDPTLNPVVAREAGITGDGKILLRMGGAQEIVPVASEQELLRGLLRLLNPAERTLYFLTGHGEYEMLAAPTRSASRLLDTLSEKNYSVKPLNLLTENAIPNDALALVILGATEPLTANEIALLDAYLATGGNLVVLADSPAISGLAGEDDTLSTYLSEHWGVSLDGNYVYTPAVSPPTNAIADTYAAHPITEKLNNLVVIMPFAQSISITPDKTLVYTELVTTAEKVWGETNFSSFNVDGAPVAFDIGEDKPGPLVVAASVEDFASGARLVVFGDALFASDTNFDAYGNGDLIINAIDWAAENEGLISLTPRHDVERSFIPLNNGQLGVVLFGSIVLLPGMMVLGGVIAWRNRRKLG